MWNCPVDAIEFNEGKSGDWYISENRFGQKMVHAKLGIAEENSGKLVTLVKNELRKITESSKIETLIIDGPPGVGCPVISSLSGATLAIMITEATISGLHDLERLIQLVEHFEIPAKLIINKYDLSEDITEKISNLHRIKILS